jgi:hypothetical protein
MKNLIWLMAAVLLLFGGCFGITPGAVSIGGSLPMITSFYANPAVVTIGQATSLLWNVTGATSITISPNIGVVGPSGILSVAPTGITTYTLIATNGAGSQTASTTITVNPQAAPPVVNTFNATPSFINPGQTTVLTWNVSGATSVRIDPIPGNVAASGSQSISPGNTTTYILTADNPSGVITNTTTVSVSSYPTYSTGYGGSYPSYPVYPYSSYGNMPVIVTFSIDPPVIAPGESTVLRWDVAGANYVSISPGPGPVAGSGALLITPAYTTYYTLVATNDYGSNSASTTVSVYPYAYYSYPTPTPILTFPFPEEEQEQETTLQEEQEEQEVTPPVTTPPVTRPPVTTPPPPPVKTPPPPPVTTPPSEGGGNRGGDRGDMSGKMPRIIGFSSSPATVNLGNSTQLQWNTNGATSVHISPNIGAVPPSGTMTVTPNHTTNYKITVSNSAGVVQHTQEVTVPRSVKPQNEK